LYFEETMRAAGLKGNLIRRNRNSDKLNHHGGNTPKILRKNPGAIAESGLTERTGAPSLPVTR
jgi:hypothetical protein